MAYIFRSIVVIGIIALNSPVHSGKAESSMTETTRPGETARSHVLSAAREAVGTAIHGATAAREAAQIMAGLDPETRDKLLGLASAGLKAQAEAGKGQAQR